MQRVKGMKRRKEPKVAVFQASELETKIDAITHGFQPHYKNKLLALPPSQAGVIVDYILAMKTEFNPKPSTVKNLLTFLMHLSGFHKHKAFKEITREDVLAYLDSYRKSEESDPLHQWIGSYNVKLAHMVKFFKWLYNPSAAPHEREKPAPVQRIRRLKRQEESIYLPMDLWTHEDDGLFLKYCPSKRIKCYHAMARDTSARPHELLKLKIRDIVFKMSPTGVQYAELVVSGKTTQRPLPLINSLPYVKDWLAEHPMRGNPDAPLFVNMTGKNRGKPMTEQNLYVIYQHQYRDGIHTKQRDVPGYFQRLLKDPSIMPEEKYRIEELLKKPWNPYVRRHTALTEKAPILSRPMLEQHGGWKPGPRCQDATCTSLAQNHRSGYWKKWGLPTRT